MPGNLPHRTVNTQYDVLSHSPPFKEGEKNPHGILFYDSGHPWTETWYSIFTRLCMRLQRWLSESRDSHASMKSPVCVSRTHTRAGYGSMPGYNASNPNARWEVWAKRSLEAWEPPKLIAVNKSVSNKVEEEKLETLGIVLWLPYI